MLTFMYEDHRSYLLLIQEKMGKLPHPGKEGLYMITYVGIDAHTAN